MSSMAASNQPWLTVGSPTSDAMPLFAVFFRDPAAIGLQRVEAADEGAARSLVLDLHPAAEVGVVPGNEVTDDNRHRLLAAWVRGLG
jgi:hypothetical protein